MVTYPNLKSALVIRVLEKVTTYILELSMTMIITLLFLQFQEFARRGQKKSTTMTITFSSSPPPVTDISMVDNLRARWLSMRSNEVTLTTLTSEDLTSDDLIQEILGTVDVP